MECLAYVDTRASEKEETNLVPAPSIEIAKVLVRKGKNDVFPAKIFTNPYPIKTIKDVHNEFKELVDKNKPYLKDAGIKAVHIDLSETSEKTENVLYQQFGSVHLTEHGFLRPIDENIFTTLSDVNSVTQQVEVVSPPTEAPFMWMDRKKPQLVELWNREHPEDEHINRRMSLIDFIKVVYKPWYGINLLFDDLRNDMTLYRAVCKDKTINIPKKSQIHIDLDSQKIISEALIERIDLNSYNYTRRFRK